MATRVKWCSEFQLINYVPQLTLMGDLWDIFYGLFVEKWLWNIESALYMDLHEWQFSCHIWGWFTNDYTPAPLKGMGGGGVVFWMHCVHPHVRQSLDRLSGVYRKNIGSIIESLGTHTHYNDVIMGTLASHITSLMIVYATVYSDADQRKHQSSTSLAFVRENTSDRWIPHTNGQ